MFFLVSIVKAVSVRGNWRFHWDWDHLPFCRLEGLFNAIIDDEGDEAGAFPLLRVDSGVEGSSQLEMRVAKAGRLFGMPQLLAWRSDSVCFRID